MAGIPIQIKVPGKLMIAGEFAVLEPYQKLVVMAVDRFVYATIEQSDYNLLTLKNFDLKNLDWEWNAANEKITIQNADARTRFVEAGMMVALAYLNKESIFPKPFSLTIKSELDDESGKKYGLGSSAAVVTATVSAVLKANLQTEASEELIFKLSALAHVITQGNGSGADVAASTYGGMLQYSSFQADWLINEYKQTKSIKMLVEKDWIYCSIKRIQMPDNIHIAVGWTGSPASTKSLVNKILDLKVSKPEKFQNFLDTSVEAVSMFLEGVETGNTELIFEGVNRNRDGLSIVGKKANVTIETPLLTDLCNLALEYGGAGKPSGAGGGDCGIAFVPTRDIKTKLASGWEEVGIQPLTLNVYYKEETYK